MKKWTWRRGLAVALGLILSIQAPAAVLNPAGEAYAYTERAATVNASSLNVRSGPGTTYSQSGKLAKGTSVTVIGESNASNGQLWYQIRFTGSGGGSATGYALSTYIRFPVSYSHDADFETYLTNQGFPDSYKEGLRQLHAQYPQWVFTAQNTGLDWNTVIQNENVLPRSLVGKNSISSYKSLADGAFNWDNSTWTGFDGSAWVAASEDIIRYYMDPRNFFDEVSVFQFMAQEYDASVQTKDGLTTMLQGTFMEQNASVSAGQSQGSGGGSGTGSSGSSGVIVGGGPGGSSGGSTGGGTGSTGTTTGGTVSGTTSGAGSSAPAVDQDKVSLEAPHASISKNEAFRVAAVGPGVVSGGPGVSNDSSTGSSDNGAVMTGSVNYADIIMNAAQQSGINPYVIAAMIIQEQGRKGQSGSISGSTGYYNYFNVGAYASDGMGAVERGLWYASQSGNYGRPWDSPEKAIVGGAQFYSNNYVKAGQNTFYLKKYNVQGSNMYKHQYMTNVDGAADEGAIFAEAYPAALRNAPLQFKIPVYQNMPASACVKPTGSGNPNNKLRDLGAEGFALTPTFNKDTSSYDLIVDNSVANVTIYGNAIDSTASVSGTGNADLQNGSNDITVTVKAENGSERQYVIHVVRQSGGPTYNAGLGGSSGGGSTDSSGGSGPGSVGSGGPGGSNVVTPGGSNVVIISPAG